MIKLLCAGFCVGLENGKPHILTLNTNDNILAKMYNIKRAEKESQFCLKKD
jgi:hypothetical protein